MVFARGAGQGPGAIASGGLDDDNAANLLALLVGLVDEQIGKGAQEAARAELQNRFRKGRGHWVSTPLEALQSARPFPTGSRVLRHRAGRLWHACHRGSSWW